MKSLEKSVFACLAAFCCQLCGAAQPAAAVSPDGKNEIRLSFDPLRYEVRRGGVTVVAPTEIGMKVDGAKLAAAGAPAVTARALSGTVGSPVYKKARVDLAGNETFADFGAWGVRLVARDDGVAYRFETKRPGRIRVDCERMSVTLPSADAPCWFCTTGSFGCEETVPKKASAADVRADRGDFAYLPFLWKVGGVSAALVESDVFDYPILNLVRAKEGAAVRLDGHFAGWPKATFRSGGWERKKPIDRPGRWVVADGHEDWLVETDGARAFPWRGFLLADRPSAFCEADLVWALARPAAAGSDFSWVRPGKVAWDWWNCFDNCQLPDNGGCNTPTYRRFIDFAAKRGVEYVIFDEGWSESLNIWKFHRSVDVPRLIEYANSKGVGIILWMAWGQVVGQEEKVAEHFAKLGAKGFKVDFMDRGDADAERFLWKFADACARHRMVVDYHGVHRPTGLSRAYPNVLNYEGVHGLEQMKWFRQGYDFMASDVRHFFIRFTAGPADYTPGAMENHVIGRYAPRPGHPGSVGTRCRQMALMALYEAPLQMLCDSPSNYEMNSECFRFMAATPTVWDETKGLAGDPDGCAAVARRAKDGSWYAAAIGNAGARDYALDTSFLGGGTWRAEVFRDAATSDVVPTHYVHECGRSVAAGETLALRLAPGGGFVIRFSK